MPFFSPSPIELEVLRLLSSTPQMYGLEMVKASPMLKRGTVYVTLMRMENKGYVSSVAERDPSLPGMPRRRYSISGHGQRALVAVSAFESAHARFA